MKQNLTELVFIIDRSGSMAGLEVDTIGGFNGMLQKQKKAEGEVLVTTVLFNHESQTIHDRVEIDKVPLLTEMITVLALYSFIGCCRRNRGAY